MLPAGAVVTTLQTKGAVHRRENRAKEVRAVVDHRTGEVLPHVVAVFVVLADTPGRGVALLLLLCVIVFLPAAAAALAHVSASLLGAVAAVLPAVLEGLVVAAAAAAAVVVLVDLRVVDVLHAAVVLQRGVAVLVARLETREG